MAVIMEEVIFLPKDWEGNGNKLRLIMKKVKGEMIKAPQV